MAAELCSDWQAGATLQSKVHRLPHSGPCGAWVFFCSYPGLAPWAKVCRPCGAGSSQREEARLILIRSMGARALLGFARLDSLGWLSHVFLISFFYVVRSSWVIGIVAARLKLGPSTRPRRLSLLELQIPRFARDDKGKWLLSFAWLGRRGRRYSARFIVFLIQVPAGPESFSALSQGLRPGLRYVAPAGLDCRRREEARLILIRSMGARALLGFARLDSLGWLSPREPSWGKCRDPSLGVTRARATPLPQDDRSYYN